MSYQSNDLAKYLSNILINIIRIHPEYLLEKYRKYDWDSEKTSQIITKYFSYHLNNLVDNGENSFFLNISLSIFRKFLVPFSLSDKDIVDLCIKNKSIEYSKHLDDKSTTLGFSVLLIDIENIYLDVVEEDLIKKLSRHSLKHYLAFGNWKKLGNKDEELHKRGYELFHVPSGKNNADQRMTSIGSFICLNYPDIKEIFVCSSDKDLETLCNFLSQKDIVVYQVFRQTNSLCIKNSETNEVLSYPIIFNELSKKNFTVLKTFIEEIKSIIHEITDHTSQQRWVTLNQISTVFYRKFGSSLKDIVQQHFPGKTAKFIFLEYKNYFVVHDPPESKDTFITLFDVDNQSAPLNHSKKQESLEEMFVKIIKEETKNSKNKKLEIGYIASKFAGKYNVPITKALKNDSRLGSYKNFINSISTLELINEGGRSFIRLR
ncbi:NYN domain-containing protein [Synechocystis sp. PCC 7339]|uniref:NYN domain-containing protein n=1 Tax=Synechocystis sp. PCC 7339 TaxID=2782213 RepID=UPI001CBD4DA2|nr:NYN domain-containing protein [Synechocystis sp. PCC 7339]UAJ72610.1 NYN domain-containing protein [Synechocystis sp. PCC 7339]